MLKILMSLFRRALQILILSLTISAAFTVCPAMQQPEGADKKGVKPEEGMIGRVTVDNVDQDIVFHYRTGFVFENSDLPMPLMEGKKFEITLHGELTLTAKTKVKISMAGGGVSHDVNWLYVDDKELGSVGDDRSKHLIKELELDKGTHEVRWVLTGGTFRSNILFIQNGDGEFIKLRTREKDRDILMDDDLRKVRIKSRTWGWPIPLDWREMAKLTDPT